MTFIYFNVSQMQRVREDASFILFDFRELFLFLFNMYSSSHFFVLISSHELEIHFVSYIHFFIYKHVLGAF